MITDGQNYFSTAQAVTSTAISENLINLGSARDLGAGQPVWIVCQVTTAMTNTGTVAVTVVNHDDEPTSGQGTTIMTLGTLAAASAIGDKLQAILPPCATDLQYLAVQYTVSGSVDAGAVDCFLTSTPDNAKLYPDAVTID